MSADRVEFCEPIQFRAERGLMRAVAEAARRSRTTSAEYLRRTIRERVTADGVSLPVLGPGDDTPPAAPAMRSAA